MRKQQIWVHPKFAAKIKIEAIHKNISVLELTEKLGTDAFERIKSQKVIPKKRADKFEFKI